MAGRGRRGRRAKPRRAFPNFFVGVRVQAQAVVAQVEALMAAVRRVLPGVAPCLVDARTLHVTLCVLRLDDDKAIEDAAALLESETESFLRRREGPLALEFTRWGFFGRNDVLFASMDLDASSVEWIYELAESLRVAFDRLGFITPEPAHRSFTPHMTVWKAFKNRDLVKALNSSRDPDDTVQDELARVVAAHAPPTGVDVSTRIDLLCMRERDDDGYYRSYGRQQLQ